MPKDPSCIYCKQLAVGACDLHGGRVPQPFDFNRVPSDRAVLLDVLITLKRMEQVLTELERRSTLGSARGEE